jgi:hypothetical protein
MKVTVMKTFVIVPLMFAALVLQGNTPVTLPLPVFYEESDSGTGPFTVRTDEPSSIRYQQLFVGTDIAVYGYTPPAWLITKIRLSGFAPYPDKVSPLEISFSTTHHSPSSLSPVFAENIGPNETLVFSGLITWVPRPVHVGGGYEIIFDQPFLYVPSAGNLLMEVKNFETFTFEDTPLPIEFPLVRGPAIRGLYAMDAHAETGMSLSSGLSYFFTMTPIPEPSIWALLLSGTALVGLWRWRTRIHFSQTRR